MAADFPVYIEEIDHDFNTWRVAMKPYTFITLVLILFILLVLLLVWL